MKELSKLAQNVHASTTMAIDSMFKQMRADGEDVIGFAAGEPDFPTPDHIKVAAHRAISEDYTKYTPASGSVELKQAVRDRFRANYGPEADYTVSQVVVSSGAKHLLYLAFRALIDPGDEVIVPTPNYVSYFELIRMVGGVPIEVPAAETEGFKPSPEKVEAAVTPRTKALILNNPCNPTGAVFEESLLRALAQICVKHDLYLISDEIYDCLVYDGKQFTSAATLGEEVKERLILINGVSKAYAMTGWRIGYALAPASIAKVMHNYVSHSTGCPCAISQKAALEGLTASQEGVAVMREAFQTRRDYMVERINAMPVVSCRRPEGAFYVMMNIQGLLGNTIGGAVIRDANDFATEFLKQEKVAVIPADGFSAPGFVRWTYTSSMENIEKGMDRLEKFLAKLGK